MSGEHGGFDHEPIPGLPERLPPGEQILWQGKPDWKRLALSAFHVRAVTLYFALIAGWALLSGGGFGGVMATALAAAAAVAVLLLLSILTARSAIYTITNRRVVFRIGVALPTCINVPFAIVETAGLKRYLDGSGDIPLTLTGRTAIGYALLWPHARPWRIGRPEPMMRCVPDAERVAGILSRALGEAVPAGRRIPIEASATPSTRPGAKPVTEQAAAA